MRDCHQMWSCSHKRVNRSPVMLGSWTEEVSLESGEADMTDDIEPLCG